MSPSAGILRNQRAILLKLIRNLEPELRPERNFPAALKAELARNRSFGSRDRRIYRDGIYTWLRFREWIDPLLANDEEAAADLLILLSETDSDLTRLSPTLLERQRYFPLPADWRQRQTALENAFARQSFPLEYLLPEWFRDHCPELFTLEERLAQLERPPVWIRVQDPDLAGTVTDLQSAGFDPIAGPILPTAVRLGAPAKLEASPFYRAGRVEIQDLGSQLLVHLAGARNGEHWIDACAGAGGKSLALSIAVGPGGSVTAHDVRGDALAELRKRAARIKLANLRETAGPDNIDDRTAEGVFVDAPCSASGTWRRHPHLRHQLTERRIDECVALQRQILSIWAPKVKPGGRLVYATCSLSRRENRENADWFLENYPDFRAGQPADEHGFTFDGAGSTLLPSILDTDGFYFALFHRQS